MKKTFLALILAAIFLHGCSRESGPYPSARYTYAGTNLSFVTPDNWSRTKIPGSGYLTFFTEIHFGIKPNIRLEEYVLRDAPQAAIAAFLENKSTMYPDYRVRDNSPFQTDSGINGYKIMAGRTNAENTPVIHIHYVLYNSREVYIVTATAAQPGIDKYENIFDTAMQTATIH